jgi:bifunctional DNase/RNase
MAVRMELKRILIRELSEYQLIELREVRAVERGESEHDPDAPPGSNPGTSYSQVEGGRSFPIVIGLPEAAAIERRLKGITIKRPQTHDLLENVIKALGGKLEAICVNDLSEHTFFAELHVRDRDGKLIKIDSRPSDAIALGIGGNVPILVEEHVLDAAQKDDEKP